MENSGSAVRMAEEGAASAFSLTGRQRQVLRRLLAGKANKQIARELGVVEKTVESHVSAVLRAHRVLTRFDLIDMYEQTATCSVSQASRGPRTGGPC